MQLSPACSPVTGIRRMATALMMVSASLLLMLSSNAASAVSLDLRTSGSYGQIGPALFYQNSKKAGTGLIQPFLRVQANSGTAEGYNSSSASLMGDVKSGAWTHDQLAGPFTTILTNSVEYYQFFLDINQSKSKPYLSLDAVQFWLSSSPINPADSLTTLAAQATKVFDLDDPAYGGSGNEVLLDYSLNSGSGEADMVMLIPKSLFPNAAKYLTLYCKFGGKGGDYEENSGFEEWAVASGASYSSVGNYVWTDTNGNGIQDVGESSLAGVGVKLYNAAGTTLITTDALGNTISPITTDSTGYYNFGNLTQGQYTVKFTAPSGYVPTLVNASGSTTANDSNGLSAQSGVLAAGQSDLSLDSGFVQPVSLGNLVWVDTNGNGIQDGGEPGLAGVVARLYDATGANQVTTDATGGAIGVITTTGTGAYSFGNLRPGQYTVKFTAPAGYVPTLVNASGSTAANDSNGLSAQSGVLTSGQSDLSLDSGFIQPVSVGDFVWVDSNGNGVQNGGEPGLAGVTVRLYDAAGTTLVTSDASGNGITSITTTSSGAYLFSNLRPGQYTVKFAAPPSYVPTRANAPGSTTANDSNGMSGQTAVLSSGQSDLTVDSGFVMSEAGPVTSAVGDLAWLDINRNGIQDSGETGLAGVVVTLYNAAGTSPVTVDASGNAINPITTDASGFYLFGNLPPGQYTVKFTPPTGYYPTAINASGSTVANDSNGLSGQSALLVAGQLDNTVDCGFVTTQCVQGDITTSWGIYKADPNPPTLNIILNDPFGLSTVVGLKLVNITLVANAYSPGGQLLSSIPLVQDTTVSLPTGTVKVVVVGTRINQSLAASYDARVADICGTFTGSIDPVITRLEIGADGKTVRQVIDGVPSFEHYVSVENGRPGLRSLRLIVNGHRHELSGLGDGETVFVDIGAAMEPGPDNKVVLEGDGVAGASAVVSIGDAPVGGNPDRTEAIVPAPELRVQPTATGLELSWSLIQVPFELQQLDGRVDAGEWTRVPEAPVPEGDRWVVRLPMPASDSQFFRLQGK